MKIAVYDFDNTLVNENSLRGFVEYVIKNESQNSAFTVLKYLIFRLQILFITQILRKSKTKFLVNKLTGFKRERLVDFGRGYVAVAMKLNQTLLAELENDRESGMVPYIISGTIYEILNPAAKILNVQFYYSSRLKYDENDLCSGQLEEDLRGNKDIVVKKIRAENPEIDLCESKFVSDNIEDIKCASNFGVIHAVVYNNKSEEIWREVTNNIHKVDNGLILGKRHLYILGYYFLFVRSDWYALLLYRIGFPILVLLLSQDLSNIIIIILSWSIFMSLYEIGYIDNDFYAVKNEVNPSIRLSNSQRESDIYKFILTRIVYYIILLLLLSFFLDMFSLLLVAVASLINFVIYVIHNRLQRKNRTYSYLLLKASHLYIPVIAVASIYHLAFSILFFYLPMTIIAYRKKIAKLQVGDRFYSRAILFVQALALIAMLIMKPNIYMEQYYIFSAYLYFIGLFGISVSKLRRLRAR